MLNKVCLIGRITKDPIINVSVKGIANLSFILAVEEYSKGEKEVNYIQCGALGTNAEYISKYITRGCLLSISGRLKSTNYEDITTKKMRSILEVFIETIDLLSKPQVKKEEDNNQIINNDEASSLF